ncbi:MAG: sigma-70 family RNA polymerase sigma factor [Chloroflexi bacterium]|nr:sigma-70 family RNA polymerase sigma factor [Chloroflexota bacterium]
MDSGRPTSALALLERAKAGDRDAFGALAEEHRDGLLRLCMRMTGSHEEAEDLVQDTLLKAYLHIAEFELRASLRTWLFRIATNACLDHQRGKKPWDLDKRWQWFRENGELVHQMEQNLYLSPERAAEVKEVAATCVNCVTMSLPTKQRAAITLCDQLGLTRDEAAKAIGASVASVKTELHRGRKKMAEVYEHHCALVDEQNECDGCLWAGRVQRRGGPKQASKRASDSEPRTTAIDQTPRGKQHVTPTTDDPRPTTALGCEQIDELLSDLIEGELAEGVRAGVRAHLASCARCTSGYEKLKRTVRFVRAQADTPLVPGTPGGAYMEFTAALAQGEPERAVNTLGRAILGWPANTEQNKEGASK